MTDKKSLSERDICTKCITPALEKAGWDKQTQLLEEVSFTDGKIYVRGKLTARGATKRADYILYYKPNIPIAIIEAKDNNHSVRAGIQQALDYAQILDIPCVFSSNGDGFLFHDRTTIGNNIETELALDDFPSPAQLWERYKKYRGITTPDEDKIAAQDYYFDGTGRKPRYYQQIAINRTVEAIAGGQNRILLVMATGTGKTYAAFQIVYRLWKAGVKKQILFLADRNALLDQTKRNDFKHFKDKMTVKQLRQTFLREAMQGKLIEQDPKDELASELFKRIKAEKEKFAQEKKLKKGKELPPIKEDEIPFEIPKNWVWCRLEDIATIVRGGSPRPAGDLRYYDGDVPFLKVADLTSDDRIYLKKHSYTIKQAGLYKTRFVNDNTLMLTNSGATLGIPKICTFPTTFNDGIAAFLGLTHIDKVFLYYFLKSKTKWFLEVASRGQGQPNLNIDIIAATLFALPHLPEQRRVVAKLEQLLRLCDDLEQSIRQSKEQTNMLLQAALREALQPKENVVKLPVLQKVEDKAFLKRKVLATYIINQSLNDLHFGDTKFEKLLHLADYIAIKRNLNQNYIQKVAGPYDNRFTYSYFEQVEGSKWFIRKKDGLRYIFKPGQNHLKSIKTYNFFTEDELKREDGIIQYFKNTTYEKPEIVSTLYAVWNNLIILQQEINDDLLIEDFYKWDKNKKRYKRPIVEKALQWMRQEGLVPDGWGKVIAKKDKL